MLQSADVARELDHHGLHSQADSEIRHFAFARVANGRNHAFHAALAESARNQNAVVLLQLARAIRPAHVVGLDPVDIHLQPVRQCAVQQGFLQALVGILVLHVLADERDVHLIFRILHPLQHPGPAAQIALLGVHAQHAEE